MDKHSDYPNASLPDKLRQCIARNQVTEAVLLICSALGGKSSAEYEPDELESLALFCSEVLPPLLNHHITWLLANPHLISLIVEMVEYAHSKGLDSAKCAHFILRLHCIQAFYYANQNNWDQAKIELMVAVGSEEPKSAMAGVGIHSQKPLVGEMLLEYLLGVSRTDAEDPKLRENFLHLYDELKDILSCVTREETRSGVVRVILVDYTHQKAVIRLLLVKIAETNEEIPKITYLPAADEKLDKQPLSAQRIALDVANCYLQQHDFPDGLSGKEIFWQLLTDQEMASQDTRAYEGDSLAAALCTAIISEYFKQPVPSDFAITGAFHVDSLQTGKIAPVNYIKVKVMDAIKIGIRRIFLPEANIPQLDVAVVKTAEEYRCTLKYVKQIDEIFSELFVKEVPPGIGHFLRDMLGTLWSFVPGVPIPEKHPLEVAPAYRAHIWLSGLLLTTLFGLDWVLMVGSITASSLMRITLGSLIVLISLLVSYALPYQWIRRKRTQSWYASIFVTLAAITICFILVKPDIPWEIKLRTEKFDLPPLLSLGKDFFIFWLFTWIYATNVFNVYVAYETLLVKRQFRTLQNCLQWDARHEGNMPITCFPFPWAWGALAATLVAVFLMILEVQFYNSLFDKMQDAVVIAMLGISRDLLFIVVGAEVLLFYKNAVAKIKKELFA